MEETVKPERTRQTRMNWIRLMLEMGGAGFVHREAQSDPGLFLEAVLTSNPRDIAYACKWFPEVGFGEMQDKVLRCSDPWALSDLALCAGSDFAAVQARVMELLSDDTNGFTTAKDSPSWDPLVRMASSARSDAQAIAVVVGAAGPDRVLMDLLYAAYDRVDVAGLFACFLRRKSTWAVKRVLESPGMASRTDLLRRLAEASHLVLDEDNVVSLYHGAVHFAKKNSVSGQRPSGADFLYGAARTGGPKGVERFADACRRAQDHDGHTACMNWLDVWAVMNS